MRTDVEGDHSVADELGQPCVDVGLIAILDDLQDRVEVIPMVVSERVGTSRLFVNEDAMSASLDLRNFELVPQRFERPSEQSGCRCHS